MKNNTTMTVSEFIRQYNKFNNDASKEALLKSIITRTYVPVLEKYANLKLIVDLAGRTNEQGVQYMDMFTAKMNCLTTMLTLYTRLTVDKDEDDKPKVNEAYDLLKRNNIWSKIEALIGTDEMNEFFSVNQMVLDTWHNEHVSAQALMYSLVNRAITLFASMTDSAVDKLTDVVNDDTKRNKVTEMVKNIVSRVGK